MTTQQNNQGALESRLRDVQIENDLLLVQIHQLEEELEHYFKRNQELEKGLPAGSKRNEAGSVVWVDDELPDALAENQRLHALVEVLQKVHQLENKNALNVKLGNILIQGVDSPGTFLAVPGKIGKIWRESSRKSPPDTLGGKGFDKVIAAYSDGGFKAVEKLMTGVSLAPAMQANAYTALARHVMNSDRVATAEAARRAYELDPRPFRLKWLAFRLHEAGDVIEAEAMLDVLQTDIQFSESEARQASQLRNESKHVRQHEAKQKIGFSERQEQIEQLKVQNDEENELLLLQLRQAQEELDNQYVKYQTLQQEKAQNDEENELLLQQLFHVQEEIESQYVKYKTLEREKVAQASQKDEQSKLAAERQAQVEQLTQAKAAMEAEHGREIEALKQAQARLGQEKVTLAGQKDELLKLAAERQAQVEQLTQAKAAMEAEHGREIEALKQAQARLGQEKVALAGQKDELSKLAAERQAQVEQLTQAKAAMEAEHGREIEALKQAQARLGQEKVALAGQKDELLKLAAERQAQVEQLTQAKAAMEAEHGREIEALKQAQVRLGQEKVALAGQKDELSKLAAERQAQVEQLTQAKAAMEAEHGREIEALKQAQARLGQEKVALAGQKEEQAKLAVEYQKQIEQLKQAQAKLEKEKTELTGQKIEQVNLAAGRQEKIEELQKQIQAKQASQAKLSERQQMMREEIVSAEAQLDLIKDMLFREPEL